MNSNTQSANQPNYHNFDFSSINTKNFVCITLDTCNLWYVIDTHEKTPYFLLLPLGLTGNYRILPIIVDISEI